MSEVLPVVKGGGCGARLGELGNPCANCGSTSRLFSVAVNAIAQCRTRFRLRGRRSNVRKPFIEQIVGDDLHRRSGKWMKLERVIDWERDRYREVVTDPESGKVIHRCEEPLSQHSGHGAAKTRRRKGHI